MDLFVHVPGVDTERSVVAPEVTQSLCLRRILVAHGVVTNRRIPFRSPFKHASHRPVFGIVHSLWTRE